MELNIMENPRSGGVCCYFEVDGKQYYADLSPIWEGETECMIFAVKDDGKVDWNELYCERGMPVTEDELRKCINEFVEGLFKVGDRVFCANFDHWGTITAVSSDSVGIIVDYTDDNGEEHVVYAYMLSREEINTNN